MPSRRNSTRWRNTFTTPNCFGRHRFSSFTKRDTIMATKRAAKGGEMGANGEWYEGGKFINTVPENRKRE